MKARVSWIACGLAGVAAVVLAVPVFFAAPSDGAAAFPRNEAGLTYGSALNLSDEAAPDLILVETTDGQEGYVYKSDLDDASGATVSTPDEAAAYEAEKAGRARQALTAAVNKMIESGSISAETGAGEAALSELKEEAGPEQQLAWVCNRLNLTDAQRSILAAEMDNAVANAIPVYQADGVTVIGEFSVGESYDADYVL